MTSMRGLGKYVAPALLLAVCAPAQARETTFVFIAKGGALFLRNDDQELTDGRRRQFDRASEETLAFAFEVRHAFNARHRMGIGVESVRYEHSYTPAIAGASHTTAQSRALMATGKYYYGTWLRPFAGIGIGGGETQVSRANGTIVDDNIAYQLGGGAELSFGTVGLIGEIKFLRNYSFDRSSQDYDASGTGAFLGLSVSF